jgi:hypothetical protein
MSTRAIVVVVALAAAAAAVLVTTTRSADSPPRPAFDSARGVPPAAPSAPGYTPAPDRPVLPAAPSAGQTPRPALTLADPLPRFEDEARDPAWAAEKERAVRDRVDRLLTESGPEVSMADLECRSRRCRFRVEGREEARFQAFLEALQGDEGFHGDAAELLLQNYRRGSGSEPATVEVVLRYAVPSADAPEPALD